MGGGKRVWKLHETGKTPLPYTNVDRWAILGNRGYCILALGIRQAALKPRYNPGEFARFVL